MVSPVDAEIGGAPRPGTRRSDPSACVQDTYQEVEMCAFTEKSIRLGFVKKVFGILGIQLLVTAGIVCLCLFEKHVKDYIMNNSWVYITTICVQIALIVVLACVGSLRRRYPANLICLLLYTVSVSFMLGTIARLVFNYSREQGMGEVYHFFFSADEVLLAVGIVFVVVLVCCLLGFQSKVDFTPLLSTLLVILVVLVCFSFMMIFFYNDILYVVYSSIGALLFSVWLVVDIQLIMGGGHHEVSPEEYIFAALNIYIDIIQILLFVLVLVKGCG